MSTELKIKLKSLAAEQRIIRKEELKLKGKWAFKAERLIAHRKFHVRPIIRATHIAYGLIRGLELHQIEQKSYSEPNWNAISLMVKKYGSAENVKTLKEWMTNMRVLKSVA